MTAAPSVIAPVQALLGRAIDYAGMFPPAGLPLPEALDNYLRYRESPDAWALGRFVLQAAHLDAFREAWSTRPDPVHPVPLAVLIGPSIAEDLRRIEGFEAGRSGSALIESVEIRAEGAAGIVPALATVPPRWSRYVEIPLGDGTEALLEAIASAGAFAKIRTGGTAAAAFPSAENLTRFLLNAAQRGQAFKATAGLHHPLRGSYRLTYERQASRAQMFGYLNLVLGAAMAQDSADPVRVEAALLETDPAALRWEAGALGWRSHRVGAEALSILRRQFFHGFGSCSFREPLDELATLVGRP